MGFKSAFTVHMAFKLCLSHFIGRKSNRMKEKQHNSRKRASGPELEKRAYILKKTMRLADERIVLWLRRTRFREHSRLQESKPEGQR